MPYKVTKVNGYKVTSPHGVKAKHTTFQKAQRQVALLRGIEHDWKPTGGVGKVYKKTHSPDSLTPEGQKLVG